MNMIIVIRSLMILNYPTLIHHVIQTVYNIVVQLYTMLEGPIGGEHTYWIQILTLHHTVKADMLMT